MKTIRRATQEDAFFLARSIFIDGRAHVQKGIWEEVLDCEEISRPSAGNSGGGEKITSS